MGLFGSKKTYVSSVLYNLAGDKKDRPDYLKTAVVGGVFSKAGASIGETLNNSYLGGPGIKMRSFSRWAESSGYNSLIGLTKGGLLSDPAINYNTVQSVLVGLFGSLVLQTAELGNAQYMYWATQYMMTNHYNQIDTAWRADFNEGTNRIRIIFSNGTFEEFTPINFSKTARYLYASYVPVQAGSTGPIVGGATNFLPFGSPFPSTAGWTLISDIPQSWNVPLNTHTHREISYSDSRPSEVEDWDSTRTEVFNGFQRVYERTVYKGNKPGSNAIWSQREIMTQDEATHIYANVTGPTYSEEVIAGGVIKGIWTTYTTEYVGAGRSYRIDTQEITTKAWSNRPYVYIYRQGSGNPTLEAMFSAVTDGGNFYPFIPFRIDNKFISESYYPDIYPEAKKAFKRSVRGDYDDVINNISDNASLSDIDYAYVTFGISLNVENNECRRYIYEFMKLNMYGGVDGSSYAAWRNQWYAARDSLQAWETWRSNQEPGLPLFGTPEPGVSPYPTPKTASIRVNSYNRSVMNYDIKITWAGISESTGTGLLKPGAKTGEVWIQNLGTETFEQIVYGNGGDAGPTVEYVSRTVDHIRINYQKSQDEWSILDIWGWEHENMIYGGKSVVITAGEALVDVEESGFLIPIHDRVFRDLPLKVSTQVATACSNIVFNCYTVVKQRWYQTGLFRIILVVVMVVISIYFPPAGGAGGLLGSNVVVGTALGYSGTTALIAGAVANSIAAMILSQLVLSVSVRLLGPRIGALIGALAGFFAISIGTGFAMNLDFSQIMGSIMKPENLLRLTNAVGNGVSDMIRADALGIMQDTQNLIADYAEQSKQINSAFGENIGYGGGVINTLGFTDTFAFMQEPPGTFLERTLMTGSDIAQMSNDLISGFAQISLNTDLNN